MKTWNETIDVLSDARTCLDAGKPCAIVLLTRVKGSAFRRPGAKLLIRGDGSMTGNVSGGCLENDLRERAIACMQNGSIETVHYNTGSDEDVIWGLGLGCDGELDLVIVPVSSPAPWLDQALTAMKRSNTVTIAWPLTAHGDASPHLIKEERVAPMRSETNDATDIFLDHLEPPPDLVIIGAGDDAIPLVNLAAEAGFRVIVSDHRPGYLSRDRFPRACQIEHLRPESAAGILPAHARTMVVIKNHALEMDRKWGAYFDKTSVAYIGLLGPQKRCAKIRDGMTEGPAERIYGPAGLDLGSEGAEQIAVSIVAELIAVASKREPIHLREREAPIHGR